MQFMIKLLIELLNFLFHAFAAQNANTKKTEHSQFFY